jgi:hypothetical protein
MISIDPDQSTDTIVLLRYCIDERLLDREVVAMRYQQAACSPTAASRQCQFAGDERSSRQY